ncbi:MAG: AmmeMemoRadiSam system protein A [Bacillota bacterium]
MGLPVVIAGLSPHPPIVVPEVGRGEETKASSTGDALRRLGEVFSKASAETLVLITPHGPVFSDAVSIRSQKRLRGDLASFGAGQVKVDFPNDAGLVEAIQREAAKDPAVPLALLDDRKIDRYGADKDLDHGVVVPLHFIAKGGFSGNLVVVNIGFLSLFDLYRFGAAIERAAFLLDRKIAVLASGDLSHRLMPGAPAGYNPRGKDFDAKVVDLLKRFQPGEAVLFPADLAEDAGECGLRPIVMMLGTLDNYQVRSEVLSYEGPFGVGYGVVLLRPGQRDQSASRLGSIKDGRTGRMSSIRSHESFAVSLARATVERYVRSGQIEPAPHEVPDEFRKRAGVFVSIHKEGMLRGCIGTTEATKSRAADEIVANAISASTQDPRFDTVEKDELSLLDYSVDVLSESELVKSESELDPRTYGVIVEKGGRRGLLLPDLPGVDTTGEQVRIAKEKAGIGPSDKGVSLARFTVTRYH